LKALARVPLPAPIRSLARPGPCSTAGSKLALLGANAGSDNGFFQRSVSFSAKTRNCAGVCGINTPATSATRCTIAGNVMIRVTSH